MSPYPPPVPEAVTERIAQKIRRACPGASLEQVAIGAAIVLADHYCETAWTKTPPTRQGWYWHWNGDEDCAPLPHSVLYSGTTGTCFVAMGQLGFTQAIDCAKHGGWWMPLINPPLPKVVEDGDHG